MIVAIVDEFEASGDSQLTTVSRNSGVTVEGLPSLQSVVFHGSGSMEKSWVKSCPMKRCSEDRKKLYGSLERKRKVRS